MKLTLLENGIDSLQSGYKSLLEFEGLYVAKRSNFEKSIKLKNAIIQIHHGIEILMKCVIHKNSEYLLFSSIDENVKKAYAEVHQKKLISIFDVTNIDKLHTITFTEAFDRLKYICGHSFSKDMEIKIKLLNSYRNRLTHAEICIDDYEILLLFSGFIDSIDMYFFNQLGSEYRTMSGYSDLLDNYQKYCEWIEKEGKKSKSKAIQALVDIFKANSFGMGFNEIKRIEDIGLAFKIVDDLANRNFVFGTDLYNGFCSGDVSNIKRVGEKHLSMFTNDNMSEYIFKFRSLIIYLPEFQSDFSPIIIFESDNDNDLTLDEELAKKEEYSKKGKYYIEGIKLTTEKEIVIERERLNLLYYQMEEEPKELPDYHYVYKYISRTIFCQINIQGLNYGRFDELIEKNYEMDGRDLEMRLRQGLEKEGGTSK